jgi:hypothetical protein
MRWLLVPIIAVDLFIGVAGSQGSNDPGKLSFPSLALTSAALLVCSFILFGGESRLPKAIAIVFLVVSLPLSLLSWLAFVPMVR